MPLSMPQEYEFFIAANIPDSTPQLQPAPPHRDAGYGVVEPTDERGIRFVV